MISKTVGGLGPNSKQGSMTSAQPTYRAQDNFSSDRINQAFNNLFGPKAAFNPMLQMTPSFYENRHQIKVKPQTV